MNRREFSSFSRKTTLMEKFSHNNVEFFPKSLENFGFGATWGATWGRTFFGTRISMPSGETLKNGLITAGVTVVALFVIKEAVGLLLAPACGGASLILCF